MNYAVILAGGTGSRIKMTNLPKQFIEFNKKPVIIYTLENILKSNLFDKVIIAIKEDFKDLLFDKMSEFISDSDLKNIIVCDGGIERIDSLNNSLLTISNAFKVEENDVVLIHDAARPFVTKKILEDSVITARRYKACVTAVPAVDTMLHSYDGNVVNDIPARKELFNGQAPDTFEIKTLLRLIDNLTFEQKRVLTGTSQICTMNNFPIYMVQGDPLNFKITTDFDVLIAEKIVEQGGN